MKHVIAVVITLLAATVLGCKDSAAPKSGVRVESASEAARTDDTAIAKRLAEQKGAVDDAFQRQRANELRQRNVDALRAIAVRWNDGLSEAGRTPRSDIAEPLKKLQTIKSDADTVEVDDCTSAARTTLQSAMTASIEAFNLFQKETGPSADSTTQKIQQGADLLRAAQQEISACLPK
jgi:hypothetical protein